MTVFLVPAARRYELYCEPSAPAPDAAVKAGTIRRRVVDGFKRMVDEGEAQRDGRASDMPERGRLRRLITRRVAEAVAEQRLLWHLRAETTATLVHPDDLPFGQALAYMRQSLSSDFSKHRRWCAIDAVIAAITGPTLFFVPGPNVVSWYFAFRAVGHYFAMRGARQGLSVISWTGGASDALTDLRSAMALHGEARTQLVEQIAAKLGLDRLSFFIERIA